MQEPDATSAPELIAEARAGVDGHVGDLLAACEDIRDFALKVGPGWTGRPMMDGVDRLVALLFARATGTYWAIVELLRIGFGDQGAMLARSLFEDMVDMHWITVKPEIAVERFPKHHEHSDMLIADALRANPQLLDPADPLPEYDPQRRVELDGTFGQYGDAGWSGVNIHDRVAAIENLWTDGDERRTLNFFRTVVHRANNQTLHVSGPALSSLIRGEDEGGLRLRFGPGPENVQKNTFGAFWIYSQTLRLILTRFAFPQETQSEFDALYVRCFRMFHAAHAR
jgi:hypothetical protein